MPEPSNIFVSWSKEKAAKIAPILKAFFEDVLGKSTIFLSHEIDSGRRWSKEIGEALNTCNAGIIIVTEENRFSPWLHFESGAISKDVDETNVIPLLWDLPIGDLRETPLAQFQAKTFNRADMLSVCRTLAALQNVADQVVARRFETNWPKFELDLGNANVGDAKAAAKRSPTIADVMSMMERLGSQVEHVEQAIRSLSFRTARSPSILGGLAQPTLADFISGSNATGMVSPKISKNALTAIFEQMSEEEREKQRVLKKTAKGDDGEDVERS